MVVNISLVFLLQMDFDLKLLQNMLDCNCDTQNRVNESTYTNIIRKWVKTVRERAAYSAPAHTSFEVRGLSEFK